MWDRDKLLTCPLRTALTRPGIRARAVVAPLNSHTVRMIRFGSCLNYLLFLSLNYSRYDKTPVAGYEWLGSGVVNELMKEKLRP